MKNIVRIFIVVMLIVWVFSFRGCYQYNDIGYTLAFDSMDNGIAYQVFYTTEMLSNYTEENSIIYESIGNGKDFAHYEINIPTTEDIIDFRIDFGNNPDVLKIKNVILIGENENVMDLQEIAENLNSDVDYYKLADSYLEISSNKNDPNCNIKGLNIKPKNKTFINYSDLVDVCILYFITVGTVWYLYKKFIVKK